MTELSLKQRIQDDMKTALKSQDKRRLGTIRLIHSSIKQKEIDERIQLDDAQVLVVLDKMLKQRRDSKSQYEQANRHDLAEQEEFEIGVIQSYLPQPLTEAEINGLIEAAITETGASSAKEMGKVMNLLRPKVQGRVDMKEISERIKQRLG